MDFITYVLIIYGLRLMLRCKIYLIRKISEFVRLVSKKKAAISQITTFFHFKFD